MGVCQSASIDAHPYLALNVVQSVVRHRYGQTDEQAGREREAGTT